MATRSAWAFVVAALVLGGCTFNPSYDDQQISMLNCSVDNDDTCPPDYTCVTPGVCCAGKNHICKKPLDVDAQAAPDEGPFGVEGEPHDGAAEGRAVDSSAGGNAGAGGGAGQAPDGGKGGASADAAASDAPSLDALLKADAPSVVSDGPGPEATGPLCGNNRMDPSETCDPPSSCPTTCPWNACMRSKLTGSAATCTAQCAPDGVETACKAVSDGCCPAGCNANNDADCKAVCGNGVIEAGELCDGNCPSACAASGCNKKRLQGTGCSVQCVDDGLETSCRDNDACCPGTANGCNATNDKECSAVCGNGTIEPPEKCDPVSACQTQASACVEDATTKVMPTGSAATCTFECIRTPRGCVSGDSYCPAGCMRPQDTDCPKEPGDSCGSGSECRLDFCRNGVCCNAACTGACEACDRSGKVGTCSLPDYAGDPLNCGGCAMACSTNHVTAVCSGNTCTGSCDSAGGWTDCDGDKRTNGCETNTQNNASHCGTCATVCPYGVCQGGICAATKSGYPNPGTATLFRNASTVYCSQITVSNAGAGKLAALGIRTTGAGIAVRLALYTDNGGVPNALVAQTGELISAMNGATEGSLSPIAASAANYWVCLVAASPGVQVTAESALMLPNWRASLTYGPFPASSSSFASLVQSTTQQPNVYAVTTP